MDHRIVCFGEVLWDLLPTGKMPGGAPTNVAVHLKYQGFSPLVLSRVGDDALGQGLLAYLREKGLSTQGVQTDQTQPTGMVEANIMDKHEVTYTIIEPVAWDFIQPDELAEQAVAQSEVLIYGSLAARSLTSRNTLLQLLALAKLKVCDVNLRPPHFTPERVLELLKHVDIAKMNHHELAEITGWYGKQEEEQARMASLRQRFNLDLLLVTRGENGAAVLTDEGYFEHPGYPVEVEDTIGSGDAFLATFLGDYLRQKPTTEALQRACAMGALVATRKGATPFIAAGEVERLIG